ncbi:S1C family serine protease [Pseudonocardia sp. H11422]|uniref:S1C family serine protease n=1 Tax=Pseudonocardia sp. H11422 TaxID=2835866 RepID=UPI001BDD7944|nr:trypsin-like peptidase domain-containing protein [Pseudonocardia sp. H11422]
MTTTNGRTPVGSPRRPDPNGRVPAGGGYRSMLAGRGRRAAGAGVRPRVVPPQRGTWVLRRVTLAVTLVLLTLAGGVTGTVASPRIERTVAPSQPIDVQAVVAAVAPAVLRVEVTTTAGGREAGTCIVLTPTGDLVTNAHVVGTATSAKVTGTRGTYTARVVAKDTRADVAWLRIDRASGLRVARLGDSRTVEVGQDVVMISNGLDLAGAPSVTRGIVSAVGRSAGAMTDLIQTDAAISSGSSGGALVDDSSRVIGMTYGVAVGDQTTIVENVGFVIPSNRVVVTLRRLGLDVSARR